MGLSREIAKIAKIIHGDRSKEQNGQIRAWEESIRLKIKY
jgi:hypothetical protein